MELFVVLTLSKPVESGGVAQTTVIRTVTADPGTTRSGMFAWALRQAPEHMQGANVVFFSVEPNALVVPVSAEAVNG